MYVPLTEAHDACKTMDGANIIVMSREHICVEQGACIVFRTEVMLPVQCQDIGYHQTMARAVRLHLSAGEHAVAAKQSGLKLLTKCLEDQSQRADKQRFLDTNSAPFTMPRKFEFQPHKDDEVSFDVVTL
jgi:hypothetical protein